MQLFLLQFSLSFSYHDDLSMDLTAVVKIQLSSADFILHHRAAVLKSARKWRKSMDAELISTTATWLILNPSREGE